MHKQTHFNTLKAKIQLEKVSIKSFKFRKNRKTSVLLWRTLAKINNKNIYKKRGIEP